METWKITKPEHLEERFTSGLKYVLLNWNVGVPIKIYLCSILLVKLQFNFWIYFIYFRNYESYRFISFWKYL